jgi:hypothetical protein
MSLPSCRRLIPAAAIDPPNVKACEPCVSALRRPVVEALRIAALLAFSLGLAEVGDLAAVQELGGHIARSEARVRIARAPWPGPTETSPAKRKLTESSPVMSTTSFIPGPHLFG